jgi:hypothetical protein
MRNQWLQELDGLVGDWALTLKNAWFLESLETQVKGSATIEWLGDAFVVLRAALGGDETTWNFVIGRNDAREAYTVLYHDERGVERVYGMIFGDGRWTLLREDPDFHQRFVAEVEADRITGHWDMSEDQGATWRKDFDIIFDRVTPDSRDDA